MSVTLSRSRPPAPVLPRVRAWTLYSALLGPLALVLGRVVATVAFFGLGLAERIDTAVTNAWPVVVVIALRREEACRGLDAVPLAGRR